MKQTRELLSYSTKLQEPGVLNANENTIKLYSELVNGAFLHFKSDVTQTWDPFLQQQNDNLNSELLEKDNHEVEQLNNFNTVNYVSGNKSIPSKTITLLSNNHIGVNIRSTYLKQRKIFRFAYTWAKSYIIFKSALEKQVPAPFCLLLCGDRG